MNGFYFGVLCISHNASNCKGCLEKNLLKTWMRFLLGFPKQTYLECRNYQPLLERKYIGCLITMWENGNFTMYWYAREHNYMIIFMGKSFKCQWKKNVNTWKSEKIIARFIHGHGEFWQILLNLRI